MNPMLSRVAVISSCALLLCLAVGITLQGQWATAQADQASFVKQSWSRLAEKGSSDQVKTVQAKVTRWQKTKSDDDWLAVTDAIYHAAESSETRSEVTIDASAGPGAIVKYQTLGQRKRSETPTTAKTPTQAVEKMYIGIYHIWSVRNGKATSDENAQYEIGNAKEKVMLTEEKKKK